MSTRTILLLENPSVAPTTAMVCERTGMSRRTVQVHTVHLTKYGHLDGGVPTDLPIDPEPVLELVPERLTPLQWASSVVVQCPTCRCILCELARIARGNYRGQISMKELALRLGMNERTVRTHARTGHRETRLSRPHSLVADGLVSFDADGTVTGWDEQGRKHHVRRPDVFTLDPTEAAEVITGPWGDDMFTDGLAERLRAETEWFDPAHRQALWIVRYMADLIQAGWPEEVLMAKLRERPHRMPIKLPYRYAKARLPQRGKPYVHSKAAPPPAFERLRCANPACGVQMQQPRPGGLCRECREEVDAGVLTIPELVKSDG
ncbi:helix-turn-helix transcriptional regulator [Streptomyces cavernicola]|uniref:Helix-turn-helix transcriptional regulator n=1 Tax=Streptomyces cavernicola TaxID=3043613 RepID=A0ABT6SKW8_9ACTN|nr:helix-turn-helix transcriptional regulator [Streptomyces sp. B-S-A6]MDI3408307.1 helix-turn-helix transcriptional regulator [Streptomyces sp. B-S-A6]